MADKTKDSKKVVDPTFEQLKTISDKHDLRCTDDELAELQEIIPGSVASYNFVNDYKCESKISKYGGKREFYRPEAEENTHNAWYIKCNIKGNDSGKLLHKRIAIKDNTAVANIPMMNGSTVMEGYIPEYDATVVQQILEHGGSIVGKTTCEGLCLSGGSFLTKYGPVMNPIKKEFSAGGSSSGSGVVVALGEADMAIGGDQGGSIRIPASSCGIVGLKPTHGLVPYTGAVPITPALDHLGPMAKSVADCALLLECIAGYDNGFDYRQSSTYSEIEYSKLIYPNNKPSKKIKVGVLKEGVDICDDNIKKVFAEAVNHLKENDMLDIHDVSYPHHTNSEKAYTPILLSGLYGSMINGCGYGASIKGIQSNTLADKLFTGYKDNGHEMGINGKMLMIFGDYIQDNYGTYHYAKASTIVAHMNLEYNKMLEQFDIIIMPTLTKTPARIPGLEISIKETITRAFNMLGNTCIFDATGHPALSLNCGFDQGLPVGLQIVGKHFDEVGVLNAASIIEESMELFLKK